MKGAIKFSEIAELSLGDLLLRLKSEPKVEYGNLTIIDLALTNTFPDKKFTEDWAKETFGYGVYAIYDATTPVYIGTADKHFLHRFESHRRFDPRPEWGFNRWALKTAEIKLKNKELARKKDSFYSKVVPEMERFAVVRIIADKSFPNVKQFKRLERFIKKGFEQAGTSLYNPETRRVKKFDLNKTLLEIIGV